MSAGRRSGPWTPSPRRPRTPASPWDAARCGGSCSPRRSAGGGPAARRPAPTRSSPPKDRGRGALHRPPPGSTVICADELGPVIPRTLPPAPGWSPGGHRIKAPLEYSRGPEKTWVYGGLRVVDGQAITMCAPSRHSAYYQQFLRLAEQANPKAPST